MKLIRVWITEESAFYRGDFRILYVHRTEKSAVRRTKSEGFKYESYEDAFCNYDTKLIRTIEGYELETSED